MATCTAIAQIGAAKNGGHAASGDQAIDAVVIELIAGMEFAHWEGRSAASTETAANLVSVQFVGTPAIHAHSLDVPNANQLNADIIAATPIIGKSNQFFRGLMKVHAMAANGGHFRSIHSAMQSIGTEQQNVTGENLVVVGIHICNQFGSERPAEDMAAFLRRPLLAR